MFRRIPALLALALLSGVPAAVHASGAWTTYMRLVTCNDVLAMQDTVWIASGEAGLWRYLRSSGRFESITREPGGLASNSVTALSFDRSGQLWAATPGNGISRLSPDGSTWNLVNAFDGLPSDSVYAVRATGDSVWIGTQGGLALWDGTQVAGSVPDLGTPSPFRSNAVRGIAVVHDSLFVATTNGVYVALLSANLTSWAVLDSGLTSKNVFSLATDGHEVFVLASGNTYRWSMTTNRWGVLSGPGTVRLLRDDFGNITCSSATGLWKWSGSAWVLIPGSPAANSPSPGEVEFGVDPAGRYFAVRDGLLREQGSPWTSVQPPGPVDNNMQNVIVDGARVWVATFDQGVSRFDGAQWRNWDDGCCGSLQDTSFANPKYNFTLLRDATGRVWTSSWGTAVERIDTSVNPPHVDRPILATFGGADSLVTHSCGWSSTFDSSGYVYVGGDTPDRGGRPPIGIDVFDSAANLVTVWKTTNAGLPDNQVRALSFDRKRNRMFAGFPGTGVAWATLDANKARMPVFALVPRTNTFDVFGIEARGDSLWILTTTNLMRFNTATLSQVSTLDLPGAPAPRGAVHPLAVSPNGTVWVASVDGVRRFRPGGGYDDYKVSNSPLANNEVRAIAADPNSGVVWFATAGGLNRFDPGYTPPPPPTISSLHLTVYPNPAQFPAVGLDLKLSGNTTAYTGEIYDLSGRVVHRFFSTGNGRVVWDGRDPDGRRVRAGVYFVRAHAGGHEASARVVVLR
jgi:ligand-binding sensor domain-containing protein